MSWRTDPRAQLPKQLFWKGLTDPLTGLQFEAPVLRASAISPLGRDPDLRSSYRGISPLHYGVVVTPSGLACEEAQLARAPRLLLRDSAGLPAFLAELALKQRHCLEAGLDLYQCFNRERSLELVLESYELALLCAPQLKLARHEQASLVLRTSWALRELIEQPRQAGGAASEAQQIRYCELRAAALARYRESYEQEDLSGLKLGYPGCGYLIAELLRERGEYEEAFRWFGRVIQDRSTAAELLRLARMRLELCQEQRRSGVKAEVPPLAGPETAAGTQKPGTLPGTRAATRPAEPPRSQTSSQVPGRPVELVLTQTTVERDGAAAPTPPPPAAGLLEQSLDELPEAKAFRGFTVTFNPPRPLSEEPVQLEPGQLEWLEAWARVRGLDASAALRAFISALQISGFAPGRLEEDELEQILSFCLPDSRN